MCTSLLTVWPRSPKVSPSSPTWYQRMQWRLWLSWTDIYFRYLTFVEAGPVTSADEKHPPLSCVFRVGCSTCFPPPWRKRRQSLQTLLPALRPTNGKKTQRTKLRVPGACNHIVWLNSWLSRFLCSHCPFFVLFFRPAPTTGTLCSWAQAQWQML